MGLESSTATVSGHFSNNGLQKGDLVSEDPSIPIGSFVKSLVESKLDVTLSLTQQSPSLIQEVVTAIKQMYPSTPENEIQEMITLNLNSPQEDESPVVNGESVVAGVATSRSDPSLVTLQTFTEVQF